MLARTGLGKRRLGACRQRRGGRAPCKRSVASGASGITLMHWANAAPEPAAAAESSAPAEFGATGCRLVVRNGCRGLRLAAAASAALAPLPSAMGVAGHSRGADGRRSGANRRGRRIVRRGCCLAAAVSAIRRSCCAVDCSRRAICRSRRGVHRRVRRRGLPPWTLPGLGQRPLLMVDR